MVLEIIGFIVIGLAAGTLSGLLGIGGAVLIIPALMLLYGFEQKMAQGTTLMLMVAPIGLLAALQYHKAGQVDFKAAVIIAICFFFGGLIGSKLAVKIEPTVLRKIFAVFLIIIAVRMWFK